MLGLKSWKNVIPDKKDGVSSNQSLCTNKDTPTCCQKMPLWLTYNKNLILNYSHTWLQNSIETSELQHGLYGTRLYAARKKNQTLGTNKHNGKITNPERYDEISTRCHEDLLQSTPVLVAADWNPTELSKEHLETLMICFTWSEEGKIHASKNTYQWRKHLLCCSAGNWESTMCTCVTCS